MLTYILIFLVCWLLNTDRRFPSSTGRKKGRSCIHWDYSEFLLWSLSFSLLALTWSFCPGITMISDQCPHSSYYISIVFYMANIFLRLFFFACLLVFCIWNKMGPIPKKQGTIYFVQGTPRKKMPWLVSLKVFKFFSFSSLNANRQYAVWGKCLLTLKQLHQFWGLSIVGTDTFSWAEDYVTILYLCSTSQLYFLIWSPQQCLQSG